MKLKFSKFTKIKSPKCDLIFFNKIKSYIKNFERVFFLIAKKECVEEITPIKNVLNFLLV